MPRWSEKPDHILGMISNYLQVEDPEQAPDRQFARAAEHAEARVRSLVERAGGPEPAGGRGLCGCACAGPGSCRGLRELPKFYVVMVLAEMHRQLAEVGTELARSGSIAAAGRRLLPGLR